MTVYVDEPLHRLGRMIMCHMVADTELELHEMAEELGLRRAWYQRRASTPHYDVCKTKRALAVKLGAVEVDRRGMAGICRRLREERADRCRRSHNSAVAA